MSQENVEIVKALYDAFERRDNESPFDVYDAEIIWDASRFAPPGMSGVFHGHEGVRTFFGRWLDAWETIDFEIQRVIPAGEDVVVIVRQTNRGRASGVEIEQGPYAQVWTLRSGRVVRFTYFGTPEEALEAVGLRE